VLCILQYFTALQSSIYNPTANASFAAGYWLYKANSVVVNPPGPVIENPVTGTVPLPPKVLMVLLGAIGATLNRRKSTPLGSKTLQE
jgi:hypothetical protein